MTKIVRSNERTLNTMTHKLEAIYNALWTICSGAGTSDNTQLINTQKNTKSN